MAEGSNVDAWGDWGVDDDDDDLFLFQTTQAVEQEQEIKLHELRSQTTARGIGAGSGPTMTPKVAAHAFDLRRENLQPSESRSNSTFEPLCGTSQSYNRNLNDALAQIQYMANQSANDKIKYGKIDNDNLAFKGEITNLRRQVEQLKQQQQEDLCSRIQMQRESKQTLDEVKKDFEKQLATLKTQLRISHNETARERSRAAMLNVTNRSVGGASSQSKTRDDPNLSKSVDQSPPVTPKHRIDPYLNTPTQQMSFMNKSPLATTPPAAPIQLGTQQGKVAVANKGSQINAFVQENEGRANELFTGEAGNQEAHVNKLENVESLHKEEEIRIKIHATLQRVIHREYDVYVRNLLKSYAAKAPQEIMARFTRGVEIKTHFPDLIENMFLYGIQEHRKKEQQEKGEYNQKNYPKLPDPKNPEIIDLTMLEDKLEGCFSFSAWEALAEVKKQLTHFLKTLSGNIRFRLYEYQNLEVLWKLLSWAKYLWSFIVFEEEFEEIVNKYPTWKDELQSWTGLVLKIAWRDFYILDLEKLVREFCLSILEIIVTTGYFDSSQRRYEILYCILKDTLIKDHLRNEKSLRKCLKIISWSIGENRNILNYLCMNNNDGNCLARILGEQVLKCFKETSCPTKATGLLLHYFHLLENLMVGHPPEFFSKVARQNNQAANSEQLSEDMWSSAESDHNMSTTSYDADPDAMMCTQFACPDKYKFEEGTEERAKRFNKVEAAACWISPREWEVKIGSAPDDNNPCQCRKILLGSTFVMLYQVVPWWRQAQVKREKLTELMQILAQHEKRELDEERKQPWSPEWKDKLTKHYDSLTEFIVAKRADNFGNGEQASQTDGADPEVEIPWDTFLKNWDVPERLYVDSRRNKGTIFDFAVQSGILFMNFCNFHSENIALAAGSEPFNDFSLMVSAANMREENAWIKEAQIRFLKEIIDSGQDDENMNVEETSGDSSESSDDFFKLKLIVNDPTEKFTKDFMEGFPPKQPKLPNKQIPDEEFDAAFRAMERENQEYWDNCDWD